MKRTMLILMGLALILLALVGCEREITGDTELVDNSNDNCLECHNGYLDQAQGEWANSVHASGTSVDYTNRGGSDCTRCHNQQGYLAYQETGELPDVPFENVSAIGCFTCHNPHENGDLSIRHVTAVEMANGEVFDHGQGNQCASCHQSRTDVRTIAGEVSTNRYWGPHHGPQGDLIEGTGGYEFPGEGYEIATSPHALVVRDACIGCHMGNPRTHVGYELGGHTWNMTLEGSDEDLSGLCGDASCHGGDADSYDFTADEDYDWDGEIEGYQTEFHGMMDSLKVLLMAQNTLGADDHATSGTITDTHLAGATYNYILFHEDRSNGIHNFKYAQSLLEASIDYVSSLPTPTVSGNAGSEPIAWNLRTTH